MRQRACDIVASSLAVFLVMALLTAATTILRDVVLRPQPVISNLIVAGSPLYHLPMYALIPQNISRSVYAINSTALAPNVEIVDTTADSSSNEAEQRRKLQMRNYIPPGFQMAQRRVHRTVFYLSGELDFSRCVDWNTKAIYISFVARYHAASVTQSEVTILDAILRPVNPPAAIANLAALQRREEKQKQQLSPGAEGELLLTEGERLVLKRYVDSLPPSEHDHTSLTIDHIGRRLLLHNSFKYYTDAFDDASLSANEVEIVLRYQVMSYSGWAPVREDVLGHRVLWRTEATSTLWKSQ